MIKNSNTKIVHRLVSKDDQLLLAGSLSIDDHEALYLNRLNTGHALCHKEGMGRPVECAVLDDLKSRAVSDYGVKKSMASLKPAGLQGDQAYQIGSWLGEDGRKLTVRFLNSLITLPAFELDKLPSVFKKEIQKLLDSKVFPYQSDDSLFSDYCVLQIMVLLNKGMYCRNNPFPRGLRAALAAVVERPNKESQAQLLEALKTLWQVPEARQFIEDLIAQNVQSLFQNPARAALTEIESTISTFLLVEDTDTIKKISQKIPQKLV